MTHSMRWKIIDPTMHLRAEVDPAAARDPGKK